MYVKKRANNSMSLFEFPQDVDLTESQNAFGEDPTISYDDMQQPLQTSSIHDRILELQESHQQLLQGLDLVVSEQELAKIVAEQVPMLLALDGGAVPGRGSYGWVL